MRNSKFDKYLLLRSMYWPRAKALFSYPLKTLNYLGLSKYQISKLKPTDLGLRTIDYFQAFV